MVNRTSLVGLVVLVGLLVACPAFAQKAGGTLRVYHTDNPPTASLHEEVTIATLQPFMAVFNNLVMYDQTADRNTDDKIVPDLATSWTWTSDNLELVFSLREGVRWHDGKPFTSADVKCTWDTITGKRDSGWRKNPRKEWYANLREVTTDGDYHVTFHLTRPQPSFLSFLAAGFSAVYPCHVPGREMRLKPIGTGPFKLAEFKPNQSISLKRNPDYWKPGRPYLDGIEYRMVPNRATRVMAFSVGEFDLTFSQDISVRLERDIKARAPNAICTLNQYNIQSQLLVNSVAPPFDDARIKKAMMLAIDRKAFIYTINDGADRIGGVMEAAPEGVWGLTPEQLADVPGFGPDVDKNREEGRRIMRDLGYGPDKPLKIKMLSRNLPVYREPAVLLMDQLRQVYVESELETVESALWYTRLLRKDFNVALNTGGSALDDPDVMLYEAYACGSERNYTSYCDKNMQARFDEQSATVDPVRRKQLVQQIDHDLQMQGVRPSIFHSRANTCWHPYVHGITLVANSQYNHWRMEDAWLDK
jgi:peptide/nickel transport system substrate-binding protein